MVLSRLRTTVHFPQLNIIKHMLKGPILISAICLITMTGCAMDQGKKKAVTETHVKMAMAYIEAGDLNGALKELLPAEKLSPNDPQVHHLLGLSYYGKGFREKARDEFKQAVTLKPDYSDALNDLGAIYLDMELWDQAISAFNQALTNILYDKPTNALYNLGRAYLGKGDYKKAMAVFQDALSRYPRIELVPLIRHFMGRTSYAMKDIPGATDHFKKSTELAPGYTESYYWLGECYLQSGKLKEARAAFETVVRLEPNSDFSSQSKEKLSKIKNQIR